MSRKSKPDSKLLKDVNFLELNGLKKLVDLKDSASLLYIIQKDSDYLCGLKMMDYSLLLSIEKLDSEPKFGTTLSQNQFISSDGKFLYHIGIIDYLQPWTFLKKIEAKYKRYVMKKDAKLISAIEPK